MLLARRTYCTTIKVATLMTKEMFFTHARVYEYGPGAYR